MAERSDANKKADKTANDLTEPGKDSPDPTIDPAAIWLSPSVLRPWSRNPKPIAPKDIREMRKSIKRFGFGAPIVARKANNEVIEGHLRLAASKAMGLERVPVRQLDLSEDEAHVLALAAWKFEHRREADEKEIADIVAELDSRDVDLSVGTGFEDEELDDLIGAISDEADSNVSAAIDSDQNFGPATAAEQGRLDVRVADLRSVVCPKCRHEFRA